MMSLFHWANRCKINSCRPQEVNIKWTKKCVFKGCYAKSKAYWPLDILGEWQSDASLKNNIEAFKPCWAIAIDVREKGI